MVTKQHSKIFKMAEEKDDLEKFLKDVDEIGSIIKNLSSKDKEKNSQAMEASEKFIKLKENEEDMKTTFDKSIISGESKSALERQQANEQEQFLKGMELDAQERAGRRKKNEADAELLKSKGNKEFKSGCYQEAIKFYTEAIKLVKYFPALYTNRAQAFIKMKNYDAAIDDCKWAIQIDENCVKAYVHCGRALQKMLCFSEAISFFKKGQEVDPKHGHIIAEYILQTKNEQLKYDLENEVIMKQEKTPSLKAVAKIIKDLTENKGKFKECIVCVKHLGNLLENSDESKTLFRLLKGFDHFGKNTEFRRLCENSSTWDSAEQETFVCEMLNIGKIATADNEHNVEEFLNHDVIHVMHDLCHKCNVEKVQLASVKLLHQLTEFTLGREHILNYAQRNRCFIDELFKFLEKRNAVSRVVMGCINNLSLNEKFALEHFEHLGEITLSVLKTSTTSDGHNVDAKTQVALVSSSFATMANLAQVKEIRNKLQCNDRVWKLCVNVLTRYVDNVQPKEIGDMVYAELGLLVNLSSDDSTFLQSHAISIAPFLLKLLSSENLDLLKRVLGVLRLLMTYNEEVVKLVCTESSYEIFMDIIKRSSDDSTISYGVKCLALCSAKNIDAKTYVSANGVAIFHSLLSSSNETIVGNSALILSNCFEQGNACNELAETSIVKDLLSLATRDLADGVKQNVAVALAKLVKQDLRFLEQLRELHGLEILHSVIQSNGLL